jgi:hypothetical protein
VLGGNTIFEGSRTLIIKEGQYAPIDPNKTSTPAWIGPGHYKDAAKVPSYDLHESRARVPFKAQPRDATSEDVVKRSGVERRRRQINECKQRMSATASQASVGSVSRAQTASLESFYTAFGEGSSALPPVADRPKPTALELAKADLLGDETSLQVAVHRRHEDDGASVGSSITHGSSLARSRGGTAGNKKPAVIFEEDVAAAVHTEESQASTPRTAASSLFGQPRGKSILKSHLHRATSPARSRAPVLNPVYSRKDLTLKLIKADERVNSQFFKVKDYTMNAFALHSPEVVQITEFEPADAEGTVDPAAGVYQNRPTGPFRKPKPIGTFTSDIFVVKPPEYVPPKPVERQDRSPTLIVRSGDGKAQTSPLVARLSPAQSGRSTMLKPLDGSTRTSPMATRSASLAAIQMSPSGKSKMNTQLEGASPGGSATGRHGPGHGHASLHLPSPNHRTPKAYQHAVLTKEVQDDRAKCERTIAKVVQRRHNSQYFDTQRALIDMDAFSLTSSASASVAEPVLSAAPLESGKAISKWLDSNDIIRANRQRPRVEGTTFLQEHKPLPSIALSLTGLLLEENPYTPEDEFMRDLFHRPASEIGR